MECPRCESVGRKPQKGIHSVVGPNGIRGKLCDQCFEEVSAEDVIYFFNLVNLNENKEDEGILGEDSE